MEESRNPVPDPHQPEPTHWNVPRDPIKSFRCPLCGTAVQLKELIGPPEWGDIAAVCFGCKTAIRADDWEYYKVLEIIHGI